MKGKKILATILALAMMVGCLPVTVFAEGEEAVDNPPAEETMQEEEEPESEPEVSEEEDEEEFTEEDAVPQYNDGNDAVVVTTWDDLADKLATDGSNIKLGANLEAGSSTVALEVPEGVTVTLDLNGCTLGPGHEDSVIAVKGNLTLNGEGAICSAKDYGVFVDIYGTFIMNGGTISGADGYGVRIDPDGSFTMNGGTISNNYNGVYVEQDASFTYNGGTLTDAVDLRAGVINIGSVLSDDTVLKVIGWNPGVFTSGLSGKGSEKNFESLDDDYAVIINNDGEAMLVPASYFVKYIERSWSETDKEVKSTEVTKVNLPSFPNSTSVEAGWYYLNSNVKVNDRVMLQGDTYLILGDGYKLDVKGLYIPLGSTLTIYGQAKGTGEIYSHPSGGAAIGGYSGHDNGNIVIHGGTIEAEGANNCAGIGTNDSCEGGFITIYGGTITAYGGSDGAAIGGGRNCSGGEITIYGGEITANGPSDSDCCENGSGIGGGDDGDGGTITINGGTVYSYPVNRGQGARIGGGSDAAPGTIVINGGTITTENKAGAGIGGGRLNKSGGTVTINGGVISATLDYNDENVGSGIGNGGGDDEHTAATVSVVLDYNDATKDTISITTTCIGSAPTRSNGSVKLNKGFQNEKYVFYTGTYAGSEGSSRRENMRKSALVPWDGLAHTWKTLQDMMDQWYIYKKDIKLGEDITALPDDRDLYTRNSQYWTQEAVIDLNGFRLDRGLTGQDACSNGYVLINEGKLTIKDGAGGGVITGGCTSGNGGGIYNNGTLIIEGGCIENNYASGCGGGIYNSGTVTIKGGSITGNSSAGLGCGIYNSGTMNLSGSPVITGNHGNTAEENVVLVNKKLKITGNLGSGALIGVSLADGYSGELADENGIIVFTDGLSGNGNASNFISDDPVSSISLNSDGEAVINTLTLAGYTISLDGDIGVNYHMILTDSIIEHKDTAYMEFTVGTGDPQTVLVKDARTNKIGDVTYYVFKCKVPAKDMTTEIKAQLIDTEGGYEGVIDTFKVKDYTDYLFAHMNDPEYPEYAGAEELITAMVNYGAYAQEYFGVNTGSLANAGHAYSAAVMDGVSIDDTYKGYTSTLPESITFAGTSLSFKSELTLSFYFSSSDDLTFDCDDDSLEVDTSATESYKIVRIRGIKAKEIGDSITIKVSDGTDEYTVTYNPLTYCYNVLKGSYVEELQNVCKALYLYYDAAKNYFRP
ncbi:hypothetical protein SAMN02910456_01423 [Ruminococcaceae bacterium YRB3002]|nr:hypothetical protein SAMN02910456_01423 [Ruminococcaceae bacterium YRB3002]